LSERDNENDEVEGGGRPGAPIDPLRLWGSLRGRWQLIVAAGVIGAFVGAAVAKKLAAPTYEARAVLTWEAGAPTEVVERTTIIESMTMLSNLEDVRQRMKLGMPPRMLNNHLVVTSNPTSNNVSVDSKWPTAEGAAALANTVAEVFLEARARSLRSRLKDVVDRYREAEVEAKRRQDAAVKAYDDFRREAGFNDVSQERELAIQQYAELMARADTARSRADAAKTELDSLRGSEGGSGTALTSADPNGLADIDAKQAAVDSARLPNARSELEAAKRQYNAEHPNVRRLEAELEALEARVRARASDPTRRRDRVEAASRAAEQKRRAAEEYQAQLKGRLDKLSAVEGKAATLLGEIKVADEALERTRQMLTGAEFSAAQPPKEIRLQERAEAPEFPINSPRKRIAIVFPLAFSLLTALFSVLWAFRKLDVRTPKEAAFWSGVPVVGASTWPRDPDMLPSLMHDLDDYAPQAEGVTLIVGLSLAEAHLARKVAEWDGHRMVKAIEDPSRMLMVGKGGSVYPLAQAPSNPPPQSVHPSREPGSNPMQILTLTGPVPAQALRRAARLADRVLVVVTSGKHSIMQMMKIKGRLGRERGIGVLLVGLEKEFALVRDRVGDVTQFWQTSKDVT
jgi:uncharacterized protein involved in exopolysaccharide biosynthesis